MKTYKLNISLLIKSITILTTLIMGTTAANAALLVSNVVASQAAHGPDNPVVITYDLYGAPSNGVSIIVKISTNAVDSYELDSSTLSGDAGNGIQSGTGKTITWTSVDDWGTEKFPSVKFSVIAYDGKATADPDVVMKPVGIGIVGGKVTDTLEWDLQSFTTVNNLQYSPLYCKDTEVTAAQYCRFLNAYKNRCPSKTAPSCAITSVFNNAIGGAWVDAQAAKQLCTTRSTPDTGSNNAFSKIKWVAGTTNRYELNVSDWHTNQPMTEVSWYGAVAYCMWLNEAEFGSDTAKWKYRLPTEWEYEFMMGAKTIASTSNGKQDWGSASWKYATRIDTISTSINSVDWVNYWPGGVIHGLDGVGTKPVSGQSKGYGQYAMNIFGCHEMSGNVLEWCLDYFGAFAGSISGKNYVRRPLNSLRTSRGGHWFRNASGCVTAYRYSNSPADRLSNVGFRVVRDR